MRQGCQRSFAEDRASEVSRVLVADDDPCCLALIQRAFHHRGIATMTCMEGRQAWAALQQGGGLYMAILNWMLPDLDGYRIAQRLYEQQHPVIAVLMVPRAVLPEAWTGLNLRARFVLTKPLVRAEIDHLIGSTIAHVFDRHAAGNDACGEPATPYSGGWFLTGNPTPYLPRRAGYPRLR